MMTTLAGATPVATLAIRELSLVWNTDSEPSSTLTIATNLSSSVIAIVLARDTRLENTAGGGGGGGGGGCIEPLPLPVPGSPGGCESTPQPIALTASDAHATRVSLL